MIRKCCKQSKFARLIWSIVACILYGADIINAIQKGHLIMPSEIFTAGSGDLMIQIYTATLTLHNLPRINQDYRLQITRLENFTRKIITFIDVLPDPQQNVTKITIPCESFLFGGLYEFELLGNDIVSSFETKDDNFKQQLDVRWPIAKLTVTPDSIGTYPPNSIDVILEFPDAKCSGIQEDLKDVPEFWLELFYAGHEDYSVSASVSNSNVTNAQVLYAEQVRGYPKARLIKLKCELFGLAGRYIVKLRSVVLSASVVSVAASIKVDWSEQFVFNVHARSISPCDPHTGIGVLFEYPACILDRADRVRLFAKQRADVASLAPPTSLHYVTEQRVVRGQHSMYFDCDLFSEKYIEYCFVYVSQAISGAVADVRMDCLPTLPVRETDMGGWGPWSEWTPCSSTCAGGTKSRYRVCDSPPPRYGAKFCQGPAVETEHCGGPTTGSWDCIFGNSNVFTGELPADRPEIRAEIGPGCRCGCIVHLSVAKPRRLIASSAESCPGRTFWLIQADDGYKIKFSIDFFRLICPTQYLKIRDGDSLGSDLIAEYIGGNDNFVKSIISTESQVLIEFYSNELSTIGESCKGGFLSHAQQIKSLQSNLTMTVTSKAIMPLELSPIATKLTLIHIMAILFASIIIVVSALLGAQYMIRYRKYQLAGSLADSDSPQHTPRASIGSFSQAHIASRAASTSTIFSEVVSLVKFRPRDRKLKHSRLRESVDGEALESATEYSIQKLQSGDELSIDSSRTLKNESSNDLSNTQLKDSKTEPSSEQSQSGSPSSNNSISLPSTPIETPIPTRKYMKRPNINGNNKREIRNNNLTEISPLNEENDTESGDSLKLRKRHRKLLSISNATLRSENYSPAPSIASSATIRTINIKEHKEKQNREKLLAGPGSEFSLANPEDFELDYYDYNVINAGAAPGSYLGMDPAYLVWIPPIDDGNIIEEIEEDNEPYYEEILPRQDEVNSLTIANTSEYSENSSTHSKDVNKNLKLDEIDKIVPNVLNQETLKSDNDKSTKQSTNQHQSTRQPIVESIQMHELSTNNRRNYNTKFISPVRVHSRKINDAKEKETSVVKSPSDSDLNEYYELDDIQFADDEDNRDTINYVAQN